MHNLHERVRERAAAWAAASIVAHASDYARQDARGDAEGAGWSLGRVFWFADLLSDYAAPTDVRMLIWHGLQAGEP